MHRSFKPPRTTRDPSLVLLSSGSDSETPAIKEKFRARKRQKNHTSPSEPGPSSSSPPMATTNGISRRTTSKATKHDFGNGERTTGVTRGEDNRRNGEDYGSERKARLQQSPDKSTVKRPAKRLYRSSSEESYGNSSPRWPAVRHSERPRKPVIKQESPPRSTSRDTTSDRSETASPSPTLRQSGRKSTQKQQQPPSQPKPSKAARVNPVKPPSNSVTGRMSLSLREDKAGPSLSTQATSSPPSAASPTCALCDRTETDKVRYFRMDSQGDLHAHYLCMFTASNLHQTGDPRAKKETTEICGFLCSNVKKERNRARRLKCKYCHKSGAAVGCAVKKCSASYHYPCGVDNSCYFQFTGSFESYCPAHIPKGTIPRPRDMATVKKQCTICLEEPELRDKVNTLITPCCNCALHRECLAGLAVNAGKHYIKCPSCNIVDNFKAFCEQVGVHVPNADATWLADEEAERAREDQEEGEDVQCAAQGDCMCPNGLTFDEDVPGRDWNIERCTMGCGTLMHAACMKHVGIKGSDRRNYCFPCFDLDIKITKQLGRTVTSRQGERETEGSPEIPERAPALRVRSAGRGSRR